MSVQEDIADNGKWIVQNEINPVDDTKTVFIVLKSESDKKGKYGEIIRFVARCMSNKTEVYVIWDSFLAGDTTTVLARIGSNQAITEKWRISSDNKATFKNRSIGFLKEIMKSDKLVLQTTPYNESPVTAIFNTTGLQNAIKPLRSECSW